MGFPRRFAPLNDITQAIAIALATVFSRMKNKEKAPWLTTLMYKAYMSWKPRGFDNAIRSIRRF